MIVFVGDREEIQADAIGAKVLAIVITGALGVSTKIRSAAKEAGVRLLSSRYDTATTVLSARGATKIDSMIDPQFTSFTPETPLKSARHIVTGSSEYIFPILDDDKRLVGILSKSHFIKPIPRQLILVDHNELSQAVKGAGELQIVEVLDHHRLASFSTDIPILVEPAKLAEGIFAVGSPLLTLAPGEVILADCKDYEEDGFKFSVSQIEELGYSHFYAKEKELLEALEGYRAKESSYFATLLVTDVNTQNSLLLISAPAEFLETMTYPRLSPHLFELNNVVSRKKQLVPYLLDCLHKINATVS